LQNRSLLTFIQTCQEHDLAVWKLQRIVMRRHLVLVNLVDYFVSPTEQTAP
jgi:hypothetical protein